MTGRFNRTWWIRSYSGFDNDKALVHSYETTYMHLCSLLLQSVLSLLVFLFNGTSNLSDFSVDTCFAKVQATSSGIPWKVYLHGKSSPHPAPRINLAPVIPYEMLLHSVSKIRVLKWVQFSGKWLTTSPSLVMAITFGSFLLLGSTLRTRISPNVEV